MANYNKHTWITPELCEGYTKREFHEKYKDRLGITMKAFWKFCARNPQFKFKKWQRGDGISQKPFSEMPLEVYKNEWLGLASAVIYGGIEDKDEDFFKSEWGKYLTEYFNSDKEINIYCRD